MNAYFYHIRVEKNNHKSIINFLGMNQTLSKFYHSIELVSQVKVYAL